MNNMLNLPKTTNKQANKQRQVFKDVIAMAPQDLLMLKSSGGRKMLGKGFCKV